MTTATTPVIGTGDGLCLLDGAPPDEVGPTPITAVHADGADLWIVADRRQLHRRVDGRTELMATLGGGIDATCVVTHRGTVWVGGDEARLWRLDGDRLVEATSFHDAPTYEEWHTPWGGPPAVLSMASDGTDLYVGVHVGGILRSTDGVSWTPTIDLHVDVHQVAIGADGTVWAATGARGLAESADRGATWRFHTDGLHGRYLLAVAAVRDGVVVGASSGHAGRDGALYRFDRQRFERGRGLPDEFHGAVGPRRLAADGDHVVAALPGGDVYTSVDGGAEWTRQATGLSDVTEITFAALQPVGS